MNSNHPSTKRLSYLLTILVVVTQLSAVTGGPDFPDPGKPRSMSREDQRQLGLQAAAQVYQQMPVLPDSSPETQYVRKLGEKLAATIPSQYSWPFEFHVIAQKEINAFALPGGPMFVNVGTITAAGNEAELAGVMAHEMAHVYMQHSAKQYDKAQTTGLLAGLAGAVLGATLGQGMLGQLGQMGIALTAQGFSLKYSRSDESQADQVGAIILYKAGYNPQSMADFFRTLAAQGGQVPPQLLSDHPNPGNREQAIEQEIRNWPPKKYATDSAGLPEDEATGPGRSQPTLAKKLPPEQRPVGGPRSTSKMELSSQERPLPSTPAPRPRLLARPRLSHRKASCPASAWSMPNSDP